MSFDLRPTTIARVAHLFERFHGYASVGKFQAYTQAVFEDDEPIAAFVWQPPPPQAAITVCSTCPQGVLALSRMVAIPKSERRLRHISKPLKKAMRDMIDRTRWPVLITYSDESLGHTGYVYACSGWRKTERNRAAIFTLNGKRVSRYANGKKADLTGAIRGEAWLQRWEHWIVDDPAAHFASHWKREAIPGKKWRSGNQAYRYVALEPETGKAPSA